MMKVKAIKKRKNIAKQSILKMESCVLPHLQTDDACFVKRADCHSPAVGPNPCERLSAVKIEVFVFVSCYTKLKQPQIFKEICRNQYFETKIFEKKGLFFFLKIITWKS